MSSERIEIEVREGATLLGYVVLSQMGTAYAYRPDSTPVGVFADMDAAIRGLRERRAAK